MNLFQKIRSLYHKNVRASSESGLTIIELLLFSAIFLLISVVFIAILVPVTRIYTRQSAVAEVNQQSTFLLQTIQRYVEGSSAVHDNMAPGVATTSLMVYIPGTVDLSDSNIVYDLLRVFVDEDGDGMSDPSGVVYVEQIDTDTSISTIIPLTTDNVTVSDIVFTRSSHVNAHDAVSVKFAMEHNTTNPQRQFSQLLQFAVARVTAATFDSNILPGAPLATNRRIGDSANIWDSIYANNIYDLDQINNGSVYFSGGNVGIGISSPSQKLVIDGALQFDASAQPACNDGNRGTIWFNRDASGNDTLEICANPSGGGAAWYTVFPADPDLHVHP